MKSIRIFTSMIFVVACVLIVQADNEYIQYQYDAAGNRISRIVVQPQPQQSPKRQLPIVDVSVSPTITSDVVVLSTAHNLDKSPIKYTLISVQGNVLNTSAVNSQQTIISLGEYVNGVYLLTVETESGIETFKIIKQ